MIYELTRQIAEINRMDRFIVFNIEKECIIYDGWTGNMCFLPLGFKIIDNQLFYEGNDNYFCIIFLGTILNRKPDYFALHKGKKNKVFIKLVNLNDKTFEKIHNSFSSKKNSNYTKYLLPLLNFKASNSNNLHCKKCWCQYLCPNNFSTNTYKCEKFKERIIKFLIVIVKQSKQKKL